MWCIYRLQQVVVVDGAHLLDREMLEELRFLLNLKIESQNSVALILWGKRTLGLVRVASLCDSQ
ncbi:ATP-binding protein [Paenibacillus sonchi]|uniref:ATP-binding protein n=1 Tax=Paenibacillus sonchi TaxID=373687 RepID=UPI001E28AE6A|nr:ATP-binding protein [Paenibacillus sonchi]MCE3203465.1 ATP-binding protein [Paenibacillus sonchi]